jgi:hypothetical protein
MMGLPFLEPIRLVAAEGGGHGAARGVRTEHGLPGTLIGAAILLVDWGAALCPSHGDSPRNSAQINPSARNRYSAIGTIVAPRLGS